MSLQPHKPLLLSLFFLGIACNQNSPKSPESVATAEPKPETTPTYNTERAKLSQHFKDYWYAGQAELTSYVLEQARYGEIRKGHSVLVFVTEDFLPDKQVKADRYAKTNIPVLKLNFTKKFNTGIYPYSIMTSTFYPVNNKNHAIKATFTSQEWCGHVFTQLNNREQFDLHSYSYFESEGDENLSLPKTHLEDELWLQVRIDPESLPLGEISIIPSLEFFRLNHKPYATHKAQASLETGETNSVYSLNYPELERTLAIRFETAFPHKILGWEETRKSGFGDKAQMMTTKATLNKTLNSAYWTQNSNDEEYLRKELGLN